MTRPPEEIEVGRRNLLAQLKHELRRDLEEYPVDVATMRDLVEVLEGLPVALDRLKAAEDVCVMWAWSPTQDSKRDKATHELWRQWTNLSGNDSSPESNPHLTDELIAELAAKRDATRAETLQHFFGPETEG